MSIIQLLVSISFGCATIEAQNYSSYVHTGPADLSDKESLRASPIESTIVEMQNGTIVTKKVTYPNTFVRNMAQKLNSLFANYDSSLRPNAEGAPLRLQVVIEVFDIPDVSESNMEFTSDISVTQRWNDPRLSRILDSRERIVLSDADANRIWLPDTQFLNEKREPGHRGHSRVITRSNGQLVLHADGTLEHVSRLSVTAYCHMSIRLFPHDRQNCSLIVTSGFYSANDFVFGTSGSEIDVRCTDLHQFKVENTETILTTHLSQAMNFSRLEFHLEFHRKIGHFLVQVYFPTIAMVILSWLVFWFPSVATAHRFVVGFATMINLSMVAANLNSRLPKVGYVKAVDVFSFGCFVFVFMALCESLLVANASPIPVHRFGSGDIEYQAPLAFLPQKLDTEDCCSDTSNKRLFRLFPFDSVDKVARLLFPIAFLVFTIVYWLCVNQFLQ